MEQLEENRRVANASLRQGEDAPSTDPPLTELLGRLSRDTSLLAQQEIALAKQEAADKLAIIKAELVGVTVGGVLVQAGVLALIAGGILALALVLPPWAAALVAGGVLLAVGAGLLLKAKERLSKLDLAPKKTVQTVKQDVYAVKEAAK
jgi:hypothetical protein